MGPEHLRNPQHQVGGGGADRVIPGEPDPDDVGNHHEIGLPQHDRLGFDPAHPPAQHAKAIDHGGVGIRADQRVRVRGDLAELGPELHHRREVFQVDLVHDAGSGRHHPEIVEGALRELEQLIAFGIPVKFQRHVPAEGIGGSVVIDLDRMVNDQIAGYHGVDARRIAAQSGHRVPHGHQIDHAGNSGEVLEHDPRRHEGGFSLLRSSRLPVGQRLDVLVGDAAAGSARVTDRVFQKDPDREGKPVDVGVGTVDRDVLVIEAKRGTHERKIAPGGRRPANGWRIGNGE